MRQFLKKDDETYIKRMCENNEEIDPYIMDEFDHSTSSKLGLRKARFVG